ncbi:fimbrial protein [Klebsiella michiganensis]|uniref:fimbrial protein n=1 Tax=Klebsiella michiganensis TaxID=1134687 RepID=UPI0021D7F8BA|nr:fimbrial protein [Klebsiella michiganensis]UYB57932.1 fimbrial protein [Klebsiella michiganensis]
MKTISFLGGVVGTLLFSAPSFAEIAGTTSVSATFTSTIEAGTCTAQIQNASGQPMSTLNFGDVFKSDLVNQSRSEPFKVAFSDCSGVKSAQYQVIPGSGGGCSGPNSNGDSFAAGNSTGFEVWQGESATGTLLSCYNKPSQTLSISGSTLSVDFASRIVIAKDRKISDVTAGSASAPLTFVIIYQ